jgi:hypothetical protein
VTGLPVYRWDGQKWTTQGVPPAKTPVYTDGSSAMTAQLTLVAPPVAATDAAAKSYVDTAVGGVTAVGLGALKTTGNQTLTGGFAVTPNNAGTFPASFTPNPMLGNYQFGTNNAAFTMNVPAADCALDILVINGASAGGVTMAAGYTYAAGNYGDLYNTTNGNRFIFSIRRINSISTFTIKALQ